MRTRSFLQVKNAYQPACLSLSPLTRTSTAMRISMYLAGAYLFSSLAVALSADAWKRLSIYQLLTDRFALTDGSRPDCWIRSYCGGAWKGIENKLDYIQGMGFDAVWISPVIHNIEGNTTWGWAYHGCEYPIQPHIRSHMLTDRRLGR